jgi:ribonuclease HI
VWDLRHRVAYWLYTSIIRPSITSASLVWWPGFQIASAKKQLSRVQRLACLGITAAMCTTPTGAMEALTRFPPLHLVVDGEARAAAHRLWSLGGWSYLHPDYGHSTILKRLQKSDPIFSIGKENMKPAYNFEPKYRVTLLTTEYWTNGPEPPAVVKELVWYTDVSRMQDGRTGASVYGQSEGRGLSISLGKYVTAFQPEIYTILTCAYEIQSIAISEKYVSICSDSQAALEALQAVKTTSPLVRQCQRALDDISTYHSVGLFWVPGHSAIRGNEIADQIAREGSAHHFVGLEPAVVGVSRQCIRRKIQCWLDRQHLVRWRGLVGTMRQAQELISGPDTAARTALMSSFNRGQSRVVTGLLTGHNTLRRRLHTVGLADSPLCRKCGAEEETSAHVLCECEALVTLRLIYLGSFFLDPENVRGLSLRAIWNFLSRTGPS